MYMSILKDASQIDVMEIIAAIGWQAPPLMGEAHPAGQVFTDRLTDVDLLFVLTRERLEGATVIACEHVDGVDGQNVLRVDEVCFPVGAIAHRHTHSGTGFRHLVRGSLRIEGEGHSQIMSVGDSWFEPAHSPVRAVALQAAGVTSFVRCMVVPAAFAGQSTFALVDPADAALPRLQMTHRHVDHPI